MNRLEEFRAAIHAEGARSRVPSLREIMGRAEPVLHFRWAAAAMVALTLGAIPIYRDAQQRQREAELEMADALLMQRVNAALARPVPRALSPLMGMGN